MKKCNKCGAEYRLHGVIDGLTSGIECPTCDCEEKAIEWAKKKQRFHKEVAENVRNIGIPERYRYARLQVLDCQHSGTLRGYSCGYNANLSGSLLFVGNVGTGKTTLALALARDLVVRKGISAKYYNCADFFNELEGSYKKNKESVHSIIESLMQYGFLVLDDFAREKYTEKRIEWAFLLFDKLYSQRKNFCVTMNFESVAKLGSIPEFRAIFDRLVESCVKYTFDGCSLRRPLVFGGKDLR